MTRTVIEENTSGLIYQYNIDTKNEQAAVYILEEDEQYSFILFCNYLNEKASNSEEMFATFGIKNASDISEIMIDKKSITDKKTIEQFYNCLMQAVAINEHEFQLDVFQRKSESEQQAISVRLADEAVSIKIITTDSLVANWISYYPSINFINWGTYHFKVSDMPFLLLNNSTFPLKKWG